MTLSPNEPMDVETILLKVKHKGFHENNSGTSFLEPDDLMAIEQAKVALNRLFYERTIELIGPDMPVFRYIDALVDDKKRKAVNKYKAQLRKAAREMYGVGE